MTKKRTKRVDLTLRIEVPEGDVAKKVAIDANGHVRLLGADGREVAPVRVERGVHYSRRKGPKYQSRSEVLGGRTSIGGLRELAEFDSVVVVDTNTEVIAGVRVSAAAFIRCKLESKREGFVVRSLDNRSHVYEFHDAPENPEMLAILKIAFDIARNERIAKPASVAFISDSDMAKHAQISARKLPIYGSHYLPEGIQLIYASTDSGQELANKLIRASDTRSRMYLEALKGKSEKLRDLPHVDQDLSVKYRYTYFPGLQVSDKVITGLSVTSNTAIGTKFDFESHEFGSE